MFKILNVTACALLLVAGAATSALADATTVKMWTFLDIGQPGGRNVALKQIIDNFEAANPDIKIQVEPQVWTTMAEKFVLANNSGGAPDISWVDTQNLGLVLNAGAAADLAPGVLSTWSDAQKKDFILTDAIAGVTDGAKVSAVPIVASTWVMMYRKDLFDAAGVSLADIATWKGATAAAAKLTTDTNGDGNPDVWGIGLGLSQERYSVTPAFLSTLDSHSIFDANCVANLTDDTARQAVQMQVDWIKKDKVTPTEALAMSNDDAIDQFAAGKFAMMVIANSRFEQIQRTAAGWDGKNLGLAPIPGNTADSLGPAIIGGWWAVMSDKSEHKEAAAKFIAYMAGPAAAALWNVPGEQVPTYRSLSSRPEMQEPKRENLRLTADQLSSRGITLPPRCNWARTQADLNLATQQVALGQQSLDDALAQAEQSTNDRQ